jgi:hypothetical protein
MRFDCFLVHRPCSIKKGAMNAVTTNRLSAMSMDGATGVIPVFALATRQWHPGGSNDLNTICNREGECDVESRLELSPRRLNIVQKNAGVSCVKRN